MGGAILVDQLKRLAWRARDDRYADTLPGDSLKQVRQLIARILNFPPEK